MSHVICIEMHRSLNINYLHRYSDIHNWSTFTLIGKNVSINLKQIRHAMLDQTLDTTEKLVQEQTGKELLNPKSVVPAGKCICKRFEIYFIIVTLS